MDADTGRLLGAVIAGIAIVATVVCWVMFERGLRVLREIRDILAKK